MLEISKQQCIQTAALVLLVALTQIYSETQGQMPAEWKDFEN
jgi:hypothetical protein